MSPWFSYVGCKMKNRRALVHGVRVLGIIAEMVETRFYVGAAVWGMPFQPLGLNLLGSGGPEQWDATAVGHLAYASVLVGTSQGLSHFVLTASVVFP